MHVTGTRVCVYMCVCAQKSIYIYISIILHTHMKSSDVGVHAVAARALDPYRG